MRVRPSIVRSPPPIKTGRGDTEGLCVFFELWYTMSNMNLKNYLRITYIEYEECRMKEFTVNF